MPYHRYAYSLPLLLKSRSQNQLPTWIAQSTISGEASTASLQSSSHLTALALSSSSNNPRKPSLSQTSAVDKSTLDADLDNYYARLAAEEAAKISLPLSTVGSPVLQAVKEEDRGSELDFDARQEEALVESNKKGSITPTTIEESSNGNGKRSRDEVDSGWEEGRARGGRGRSRSREDDLEGSNGKRMRIGSESKSVTASAYNSGGEEESTPATNEGVPEDEEPINNGTPAAELGEYEEEDDDEYELEEGGDPNPLIAIGDKMVPFLEVGEELQTAMVNIQFFFYKPCWYRASSFKLSFQTPEEYTAYWDVYQRLG